MKFIAVNHQNIWKGGFGYEYSTEESVLSSYQKQQTLSAKSLDKIGLY